MVPWISWKRLFHVETARCRERPGAQHHLGGILLGWEDESVPFVIRSRRVHRTPW